MGKLRKNMTTLNTHCDLMEMFCTATTNWLDHQVTDTLDFLNTTHELLTRRGMAWHRDLKGLNARKVNVMWGFCVVEGACLVDEVVHVHGGIHPFSLGGE